MKVGVDVPEPDPSGVYFLSDGNEIRPSPRGDGKWVVYLSGFVAMLDHERGSSDFRYFDTPEEAAFAVAVEEMAARFVEKCQRGSNTEAP